MPYATPDLRDRIYYPSQPIKGSLSSGASTLSGTLSAGVVYSLTTTTTVYFRTGTASVTAVQDDNPLWTNERVDILGHADTTRVAMWSNATGTYYLTAYGTQ